MMYFFSEILAVFAKLLGVKDMQQTKALHVDLCF